MKSEEAKALFRSGANCAQAVLGAFAKECGLESDQAMRLASSFGAGMARLREVCGAVSGMFMVIGLKEGYCDLKSKAEKDKHYARAQALAAEFKGKTGSLICRELLGLSGGADSPVSEERTPEYYRKRPCTEIVGLAAQILEKHLRERADHPAGGGSRGEDGPSCGKGAL
ncbi:MAG: C-GCAxxG-C-C family protein [Kiritimatiellae bacterium]|nr:C-GCAxxG-C-C family protein [Kiritimatiellia bacterium]